MGIEKTGHLNPPSPCACPPALGRRRELEGGVYCSPSPRPSPSRGEGVSDDEGVLAAAFKLLGLGLGALAGFSAIKLFAASDGPGGAEYDGIAIRNIHREQQRTEALQALSDYLHKKFPEDFVAQGREALIMVGSVFPHRETILKDMIALLEAHYPGLQQRGLFVRGMINSARESRAFDEGGPGEIMDYLIQRTAEALYPDDADFETRIKLAGWTTIYDAGRLDAVFADYTGEEKVMRVANDAFIFSQVLSSLLYQYRLLPGPGDDPDKLKKHEERVFRVLPQLAALIFPQSPEYRMSLLLSTMMNMGMVKTFFSFYESISLFDARPRGEIIRMLLSALKARLSLQLHSKEAAVNVEELVRAFRPSLNKFLSAKGVDPRLFGASDFAINYPQHASPEVLSDIYQAPIKEGELMSKDQVGDIKEGYMEEVEKALHEFMEAAEDAWLQSRELLLTSYDTINSISAGEAKTILQRMSKALKDGDPLKTLIDGILGNRTSYGLKIADLVPIEPEKWDFTSPDHDTEKVKKWQRQLTRIVERVRRVEASREAKLRKL